MGGVGEEGVLPWIVWGSRDAGDKAATAGMITSVMMMVVLAALAA